MKRLYIFASLALKSLFASSSVTHQLDALQQIRDLIPERLWVQEFSLLIDPSFETKTKAWINNLATLSKGFRIAQSPSDFFLYSTLSGQNVRLLDFYEQFEQSPFWQTPYQLHCLEWLEEQ